MLSKIIDGNAALYDGELSAAYLCWAGWLFEAHLAPGCSLFTGFALASPGLRRYPGQALDPSADVCLLPGFHSVHYRLPAADRRHYSWACGRAGRALQLGRANFQSFIETTFNLRAKVNLKKKVDNECLLINYLTSVSKEENVFGNNDSLLYDKLTAFILSKRI